MSFYYWQGQDLILKVRIQPKAASDEFAEVLSHEVTGDQIKIRITAPPVDGKANKHLIRFLSLCFKVPKSSVTVLSGETSRNKKIKIQSPQKLPAIIEQA